MMMLDEDDSVGLTSFLTAGKRDETELAVWPNQLFRRAASGAVPASRSSDPPPPVGRFPEETSFGSRSVFSSTGLMRTSGDVVESRSSARGSRSFRTASAKIAPRWSSSSDELNLGSFEKKVSQSMRA